MHYILILIGCWLLLKGLLMIMSTPWFWLFLVGAALTSGCCCCCRR